MNWRTAAGVAVMVGVVAFFSSPRPHLPSHAVITVQKVRLPPALGNPDGDRQVLQQLEQLFPREVDAVVEDNGKVDLSIAQSPEVGGSQPIVVVFQRQKTVIRVLSYSGHKFSLPLDGREHRFEILATATGGVILEENDQAWLATSHTDIAGYSVEALALEASL